PRVARDRPQPHPRHLQGPRRPFAARGTRAREARAPDLTWTLRRRPKTKPPRGAARRRRLASGRAGSAGASVLSRLAPAAEAQAAPRRRSSAPSRGRAGSAGASVLSRLAPAAEDQAAKREAEAE